MSLFLRRVWTTSPCSPCRSRAKRQLPLRARSSIGWAGGALTYQVGLEAHKRSRAAPKCPGPPVLPVSSGLRQNYFAVTRRRHFAPNPVRPFFAANRFRANRRSLFLHTRYDAYGVPIGFTLANALTTLLYSGEMTDQLTGLQYLRARYYNPATGTFNRLDPFAGNLNDPQSLHKYLYTHGDPVNGIDPSGESFISGIATVALMGAAFSIVGNGLANLSHQRPFFENAGSAALWGGGLAVLGVLFPWAGVLLAGVGLGFAIDNFRSVWNSSPPPTPGQLWAASGLLLMSAIGALGAAKYGAHTSSKGLFGYNPAYVPHIWM